MRKILRKIFPVIATVLSLSTVAQTTITTIPPLSANNGSTAITFEMSTTSSIFVTGLSNTFNTGTINAEVWYRVGGVLHAGATTPSVTTANGWVQAGTATISVTTNTAPTAIPIANLSIPINPGTPVGFCITGGTRYMTYNASLANTHTAGGATVYTGPGYGFGGGFPSPTIATRSFLGSVTFVPAGPCINPPYVGAATSNKLITCSGENFTLGLDTFTSGTGQSYQWQLSPNNTTWTNIAGATGPSYQTSQTSTNYYRCIISCTASDTSAAVMVTTSAVALPAGTYTINGGLATGGTNFSSFADFKQAIVCGGIAGPIVVNVVNKGSAYNEQIEFGAIGGASSTNTITINGNGQTLTFAGGTTRATLLFNGSSHFKIKNLIVEGSATTNCFGVHITGGSEFIEFDSCQVVINPSATSSTTAAFTVSGSLTSATTTGLSGQNLKITNCIIEGGYYGFALTGPTSNYHSGSVVTNNIIRDAYLYQAYLGYQDSLTFSGNDINRINRTGTITTFYGIYVVGNATDLVLTNNRVHNPATQNPIANFTAYPIYLTTANATAADPALIANNAIYNLDGIGTRYAMYITSGNFLNIYHNTISVDNVQATGTGTIRALFLSTSSGTFEVKNNLFSVTQDGTGTKHCIYLSSSAPTFTINNNQYYMGSVSGSNHIGYYTTNRTSFSDWQSANSGAFDQNGVNGDPVMDTSGYTPQSAPGNGAGANLLAIIPTDIFGAARTATPDIGAAEYTPLACLQPFNIAGTAALNNVTLTWTNVSGADSVRIEYGPSGFVQGTGTTLFISGDSTVISGLNAQTCYDFYLTTYCAGSAGNGFALYTLCTPCGAQSMPYTETFATWPPQCFDFSSTGTWNWSQHPSGYAQALFWNFSTGVATMKTANVSITAGAQVLFKWAHLYSPTYPDDQLVVRSRILNSTTWDTLANLKGPNNFNSPNATNIQPPPSAADFILNTSYLPPSYIGQVAEFEFIALTDYGPNLYIDEFKVEQVPPCTPPIGLAVGNLTPTSGQITWSTISGTCFDIEYGPAGFTQGTGVGGTVVSNVSSPYTLGGLSPNTQYDIYIRDCCNPNLWVGPVTFKTNCLSQLSGTYTINKNLPASATNFESIADFVDALGNCGISGPVTATITAGSGPYLEQVSVTGILGASATNTVTINGNNERLAFASLTTTQRGTFTIDGAAHIIINDLEIEGTGTTNCYAVELRNGANNITFDGCYIHTDIAQTSSLVNPFVMSDNPTSATTASAAFSNITIKNGIIEGGYYGLILNGPTAAPWSTGNVIENNEIRDFYLYGIYGRGQLNTTIKGNDINRANRGVVSTFYAIYLISNMEGVTIDGNQVHHAGGTSGSASFTAYPFYITGATATTASPLRFMNNLLYEIGSTGTVYGMYILGTTNNLQIYHNTLDLSFNGTSTGTQRNIFITSTSGNFDIRNNILSATHSGTGTKHLIYLSSTVPTYTINYNHYHMNSGGTGNHIGYYGANFTTLANWQTANSGAFAQNAVQGDPVFASPLTFNMTPLSGVGNNNGQNLLTTVGTDFYGVARTATPDRGAIEFTPLNNDIALVAGALEKGQCLSTTDTVQLTIQNVIGGTVDFTTTPVTATWNVTGPVNSNGTVVWNTGSMTAGASAVASAFTVNLSVPGIYTLNAYIPSGTNNQFAGNDTLLPVQFEVRDIFRANPRIDTVFNGTDSVEISVQSPFLPGGNFFITEVCHFKTTTGTPAGGWPTYLLADDYIEITGVPGSDLAGYTLEQWTTSLQSSYTFPAGTVLSPNGTAVFGVGQLGSSTPSPPNFYYHANGTYTGSFSSGTAAGRILKDVNGNIVDAVGYSGYNFPAAANVSAADWSNSASGGSGTSGQRLIGPDNNTGSNWVVSSSTNPQNPNTLNANVPLPNPQSASGFNWSFNGSVIDTNVTIHVGPWANPGVYKYVATFLNTPCGTLTDTVTIYVNFPVACNVPSNVATANLSCAEVDITWTSDPNKLTSYVEYGVTGYTPGTGTLILGAISPQNISGLTPGASYDVYIVDSCALGLSNPALKSVTTPTGPLPTVIATNTINVTFTQADVQFDASGSADYNTLSWDFGDGTSGTGVNPIHTYTANGSYTVVVTGTNGCGNSQYSFVVVVSGISIEETLIAQSLNLYPNPNNGNFRVEFEVENSKDVALRVMNMIGQIVYQRNTGKVSGSYREDINLSNQAAGVYNLQIITEDGTISRKVTIRK